MSYAKKWHVMTRRHQKGHILLYKLSLQPVMSGLGLGLGLKANIFGFGLHLEAQVCFCVCKIKLRSVKFKQTNMNE